MRLVVIWGAISDRSKVLYFNHQTVGQYQMAELDKNPHASFAQYGILSAGLLDEFDRIWEKQAEFHKGIDS